MPVKQDFDNEMDFYDALRDWFAGQAMAAIIGKLELYGADSQLSVQHVPVSQTLKLEIMEQISRGAYSYADAMILEKLKK